MSRGSAVSTFHFLKSPTYIYIYIYIYIYFFFDTSTQVGGEKIQTSDLRFIRRGLNQLNYLLRIIKYIIIYSMVQL
jgi:hypothetical protein